MYLDFPSLGNPRITAISTVQLFDDQQCDQILGACDPDAWSSSLVEYSSAEDVDQHGAPKRVHGVRDDVRRVTQQPLPPVPQAGLGEDWPMSHILRAIAQANDEVFRFDIRGISPNDPPSVLRYLATDQGCFTPHTDIGTVALSTRKISYSLLLNDPTQFSGGDLRFASKDEPAGRQRGTLTMFASFQQHEVTPVTEGERYVIVGWVHGPAFR